MYEISDGLLKYAAKCSCVSLRNIALLQRYVSTILRLQMCQPLNELVFSLEAFIKWYMRWNVFVVSATINVFSALHGEIDFPNVSFGITARYFRISRDEFSAVSGIVELGGFRHKTVCVAAEFLRSVSCHKKHIGKSRY